MTETPLATPATPALRLTRRAGVVLGGCGLLLLAILLAVSVGAVPVPLSTVWGVLAHHLAPGLVTPDWTDARAAIVWDIR
ncbi:MAG: iron ABC transporter permease, partial [Paracoccaceae bacterium]|nr:iron ABC transporter permease [Paracoccaceae bacterium]